MHLNNRQQSILALLQRHNAISVADLSEQLYFSPSTVRRDLETLEKENLLRRTHGGAALVADKNAEIPLDVRTGDNRAAKEAIARAAAGFVTDGDSLFMDSSSTVLRMLPYLAGRKDLTVITNGLKTAGELARHHGIRTVCTGGVLRERSLSFIGHHARAVLSGYNVNKLFFSARAISPEKGVSDIDADEAELRRIMLRGAERAFVLMDASKLDTLSLCHICGIGEVDALVTDAPLRGAGKWGAVEVLLAT